MFVLCILFCLSSFCVLYQDKQNTQHKHRKLTGQPGMGSCKHWIQYIERRKTKQNTQQVFYVCVVYFVCLRSVYCIQCLQLTIPGCPVSFLCVCCVFCFSSFCVLYPMFTAAHSWLSRKHWIQYTERRQSKQNTQHKHRKLTGQSGMGSCKHWIQYTERVLYPMLTAAHCWLSCRFSMFVLCILFVFVL
jgi:hypothetical protein